MQLKNKKSQSEIITTILLILIALTIVAIVSVFVVKLVRNSSQEAEAFTEISDISIQEVSITQNTALIKIVKGIDKGVLEKVKIVIKNSAGDTQVETKDIFISALETKEITIDLSISDPNIVEIYPIAIINGKEIVGPKSDYLEKKDRNFYSDYVVSVAGINCTKHSDCGISGYIGNGYCNDTYVYMIYINFTCNNQNTSDSYCSNVSFNKSVENCSNGCLHGNCIVLNCTVDGDCDDDSSVLSCIGNSVYNYTHDFSCTDDNECNETISSIFGGNCTLINKYCFENLGCVECIEDDDCLGYETCNESYSCVSNLSLTDGLIHYWDFEEGTGNIAKDIVSGNNGSLREMEAEDWVSGIVGDHGLKFDGSSVNQEIVVLSKEINLLDDTPWTISYWYNQLDNSQSMPIGKRDDQISYLWQNSNNYLRFYSSVSGQSIDFNFGFNTLSQNHLLTLVSTGESINNMILYFDGEKKQTKNVSQTSIKINAIAKGYSDTTVYNWKGKLDDIRIYNRTLSDTEVEELYAMGI